MSIFKPGDIVEIGKMGEDTWADFSETEIGLVLQNPTTVPKNVEFSYVFCLIGLDRKWIDIILIKRVIRGDER